MEFLIAITKAFIFSIFLIGGANYVNDAPVDYSHESNEADIQLIKNVFDFDDNKIVRLINDLREQNDLPRLELSAELKKSSLLKVDDMIENLYFSHTNPDGERFVENFKKIGYKYSICGEILGIGFTTEEGVVEGWLHSLTHKNVILEDKYKEINCSSIGSLVACHFGNKL